MAFLASSYPNSCCHLTIQCELDAEEGVSESVVDRGRAGSITVES